MIPHIIFIFSVILFGNVDARAGLGKSITESVRPSGRIVDRRAENEVVSRSEHDPHSWHFGYRNVPEWGQHHPECNGKKQSPIDLRSNSMTKLKVEKPFTWTGYRRSPENMTIVNNGHTVQISGYWENENTPCLCGGSLTSDYVFKQLHFHWGPEDTVGSEHTINNMSLPLEMHMVHYKKSYGSIDEALKFKDGLAVVGILFKVKNSRNSGIQRFQKYHEAIESPGPETDIKPFPLSLFQLNFPGEYVSYSGSLTTPPCKEIVTWIIPAVPRVINRKQIDVFRNIHFSGGDDHNYRPIMPLNGRTVYYIEY